MPRPVELLGTAADDLASVHALAFSREAAWRVSEFRDLLNQPATLARGIRDNETLVAFILIQLVEGEAEILTLATAPQAQRRGHARTLVANLEQELRPSGLQNWLLDVAADNAPALAFYESLGFQTDSLRRNYYKRLEGGSIDAILMSKTVGGQIST